MRALMKFAHGIDSLSEFLGKISTWLVVLVVVVGFYNVAVRYLGRFTGQQLSSNVLIETQWYIYSVIFFLAFPYVLLHDVNVRVDFLYSKWNHARRAWIDLIGTLIFVIPFCILGIYVTLNPVLSSWGKLPGGGWGAWELSPDPGGLPRAPIKTLIIVAFGILLLQSVAQTIKYLGVITGHHEVEEELEVEATGHELIA